MKRTGLIICLLFPLLLLAQNKTQTIRGIVLDKDSRLPLAGATIAVLKSNPTLGANTDENGKFTITQVPLGRQAFQCTYLGYETYNTEEIIVGSGKEIELQIEMLESATVTETVIINASRKINAPINELAVVSARSFSVEETERIPASINDPGRMALSYPGVTQGGDDTENDIIVRGNSSFGILWRLEGIDVPNPNHFARPGTSGGGITVFSAQLLSRSDFYTGGFPAEFGNAISGVFDIRFRKGNRENREHKFRLGLLGIDFSTEGPIRKGRSSYLVNYRYSTLGLLSQMGFYVVGERVINTFQDLSFNLAFDSKDNKGAWTVFGLAGRSLERKIPVANPLERDPGINNHWEDAPWWSTTGALGTTYTRTLSSKSYLKWVAAAIVGDILKEYDTLSLTDERYRYNTEQYTEKRLVTSLVHNYKFSAATRLKSGIIFNQIFFNAFREQSPRSGNINIFEQSQISISGKGSTQTLQAFSQINHRLSPHFSLNAGFHYLQLLLNNTYSIEPRASLSYQPTENQRLSLAYGIHGKTLPLFTYFYTVKDTVDGQVIDIYPNRDMKLVKAQHLILGYNYYSKKLLKISVELYYQRLFNVPVEAQPGSLYWMLNDQAVFPLQEVVSEGKGTNYGIDLSIEKFFSNKFYFLINGSFFKSTFETWDGRVFPTNFADNYTTALTFGREFSFKNSAVLQAGFRAILSGGARYTPLDVQASALEGTYVPIYSQHNGAQTAPYFRVDTRIAYRYNKKKYAAQVALDIQNVSNYANARGISYDPVKNELYYALKTDGFVPVLSFEISF
jgi:hypothetical protein